MNIRKADEKDIPTCVKLSKIPEFALPGPCYPGEKYFQDALKTNPYYPDAKRGMQSIKGKK